MPKSQFLDPAALRKSGTLELGSIPINQYQKSFAESASQFSKEDLLLIFHDMRFNREFENMINSVRATKEYNGIPYTYIGPAHLSIGMEAEAAGLAYTMEPEDFFIGAHRAHGEVLCKAFWAIRKMSEEQLQKAMETFPNILKVVEKYDKTGDIREIAKDFFIYGFMAETFGRDNGFEKSLGGAPHLAFPPFGIYPNNAIVGGSAGIGTGLALFKKLNRKPGLVVCSIGDGSFGCGPVYEAINFSAMAQLKKLWDDPYKGNLPIIFNVQDNFYGMGGQTDGETMAFDVLARLGAGFNAENLHAERVDGLNPFAVIDAHRRKRDLVKQGDGPVLLDIITYRQCGHSTTDASSYRTKEEVDAWIEHDSIAAYRAGMVENKLCAAGELDAIEEEIKERISRLMRLAIDDEVSPLFTLSDDPNKVRDLMFTNERIVKMDDREPEVLMPKEENPRVQKLKKKLRYAFDQNGKPVSKLMLYSVRDALFEAILDKFYEDPTLVAFGEDNRDWGGAFGVYAGLTEALPYHRMFNAPISEEEIVAASVGYAMAGGRAIPELMYTDFLARAADSVFNQLPKWQAMGAGMFKMPVVLRLSCGAKYGPQHAQDWSSLCAHIPGLKVVYPVTPYDCKGLMNTALSGSDPVVFFESQRVYDLGEMFHQEGVPEGYYEIPLGEPDIKREGKDVTVLTIGPSLYAAVDAAAELEKYGYQMEIIDARSLVPFNYDLLIESVKKTGRLVIVTDAVERGSFANDIARNITEFAFSYLDAPPVVVGAPNVISPFAYLDKTYYPQPHWILDAIHEKLLPLEGYVAVNNYTSLEKQRRARLGI